MDVWPINVADNSTFTFAVLLVGLAMCVVAPAAQYGIGMLIDPPPARAAGLSFLAEGALPSFADCFVAAHLVSNTRVANTLLACAFADGWLVSAGAGGWRVLRDAKPRRELGILHEELARLGDVMAPRPAAMTAALVGARLASEGRFDDALVASGMIRAPLPRLVVSLVPVLMLAVLAFILVERPTTDDGVWLLAVPVLLLLFAVRRGRFTARRARYRHWLDAATQALRDDVITRRRTTVEDAALAVAAHGPASLPFMADIIAARRM